MSLATATHLDGPKLVRWLHDRGALPDRNIKPFVGRRWESQVRRWRDGRSVRIATADEFLLSLGVQLGEVPEEIYIRPAGPNSARITDEERGHMATLRRRGMAIGEIARRTGRDHKSVRNHLGEATA